MARCTLDGFAFDVECLYLAGWLGYRFAEVPVEWSHVLERRGHLIRDSARMLRDPLKIRIAAWAGRYPRRRPR